jgi:hypothetical protein
MKKVALAGVILVLVAAGVVYNWTQRTVHSGADGAAMAGSVTGEPPQATAIGINWVTVRDTREKAFSIQVPQGWKTYGGLYRFSAIDARMLVDATSPDGLINLRIGDATVPQYKVPGPFLRPGPGVAEYASGNVFATKYGQARFASLCEGLQLTNTNALAPKYHPGGAGMARTTGGDVSFTCTKNGVPMAAYVYAETTMFGPGGPGSSWLVVALGSWLAPREQANAASKMLDHASESLVLNPAWLGMQNQLNSMAIRQIDASTQATIAATNAAVAHQQAMISALQNDSFNDVINGVQEMQDTSTGQKFITPLGTGKTQWVYGDKAVVESGLSPGVGFTQLTPAAH